MTEPKHFSRSEFTFDMNKQGDRVRMLRKMWSGEYRDAVGAQAAANPELAELLQRLTTNDYKDRQRECPQHAFGQSLKLEGVLSDICRWQSQKQMPLWTALNAVEARRYQCSEPLWDCFRLMHPGVLPTATWTDALITDARQYNPGCPYQIIAGVAAVIFDNYQRQCKYKSLATVQSAGYRLEMTNWGKFSIPLALQPPGFDPVQICALLSAPARTACHLLTLHTRAQFPILFAVTSRSVDSRARFWSLIRKF